MTKKALVTGASRGIGAAIARRLAKRGYEVWLAARSAQALEATQKEIEAAGGRAHTLVLDVSRPEETEAKVAQLDREVGGLDMVVANAGIGGTQVPAAQQTFAGARATLETNVMGALATLLPVIPGMVERKSGHIAGVTSLAGEIPLPAAVDYGTSKAALSFFLASAAADLVSRGVLVTDIRPGFVRTDLTAKNKFPMPFLVELDDAAELIDRGLASGKRVIRFPAPLTTAISAGRMMPAGLRDRLVNSKRPI